MSNRINYGGSLTTNSIRSGNFNVKVNNSPGDLSGFRNGISPIIGGYTIYVYKASNGPAIYTPKNDTELVQITNSLGGGVSTAGAALTWITGQGTMTILNNNYPPIVTSGLSLNVDAGFVSSYPRTGVVWRDLSGNGNGGELVNGVSYSDGAMVSDGSNDGILINSGNSLNIPGKFTIDGWVLWNVHKDYGSLLVKGPGGSGNLFNYCFFFYAGSIICGFGDGNNFYSAGVSTSEVQLNTWHHITGVYTGDAIRFYLNGVLKQSNAVNADPYQNSNPLNIIQPEYPIDGRVASAKVYNRALSDAQVLQNYQAGLQRFIPTSGLVLSLDAQNTNLYAVSSTTAYDVSGGNYLGTLVNGVGRTSVGDTSWRFDGVDDSIYLQTPNNPGISNNFSINSWVYCTNVASSNNIVSKNGPYFMRIVNSKVRFNILTDSGGWLFQDGTATLSNNNWYFLSMVYNGSTFRGYINGLLEFSVSKTGTPIFWDANLYIGYTPDGGEQAGFSGLISQVQIYNRALSKTEISTIYDATKSRYIGNIYENLTYSVGANLTVTNNGTDSVSIFKTSGTQSWDNQAYSLIPFTAPCTIEFNKQSASGDNGLSYAMIGWNEDPLANASYDSIDYASYPYRTDNYSVYNNATQVHYGGSWSTANKIYIVYDTDGFIKHYNGSTLLYSGNYGTGKTVYMDSSFYSPNSTFGGFSNIKVIRSAWNGTSY